MKTKLNIKNFRVFDENGVVFELNPITVLTGSNSSGKSTAVKALFLLNSFLSQIKKAADNGDKIELDKYKLDFSQYPINLLGRFDKVIHDGSKSKEVTIEYTMYSLMMSKEVNVQFVFVADENDELNNAFLNSISMSTDEGIFYSSRKEQTSCNLNIIKEDFTTFLIGELAVHAYSGIESAYEFEGSLNKEQYEAQIKEVIDYLRSIDKERRTDILRYVRTSPRQKPLVQDGEICNILQQTAKADTIFDIPLLNYLLDLEKDEVADYIFDKLVPEDRPALRSASKKILDAFKQSVFSNFDEFFKDFESKYLENANCLGGPFQMPKKGVHLLTARELTFKQNYILFSPYNTVATFDWNKDCNLVEQTEEEKQTERQAEFDNWENRKLTFVILYEVVLEWNRRFEKVRESSLDMMTSANENDVKPYEYTEPSMLDPTGSAHHKAYELLTKFAEAVVLESVTPDWAGRLSYISSSRADVSRLYTLDSNDDFAVLLQNYFENKRVYLDYTKNNHNIGKRDYVADSFLNRWIRKFEVGHSLTMHIDDEGLGVQIRLHKKKGDAGRLLADEGYGITQLVSILLQIESAILSAQGERVNRFWRLENLDGYDFEQFHYEINTIAVEEPEIHLHPKYQSLLADMFVEAYEKFNIHFVVETHSEYLIRKLQLIASGHGDQNENGERIEINRSDVSIFYVNSLDSKSQQKVKRIAICSDGYLDDSFGEGFYDEATRLSRRLM